ncbi:MAG: V-type ATP synthase subunit E [Anaerolineales bacterium]
MKNGNIEILEQAILSQAQIEAQRLLDEAEVRAERIVAQADAEARTEAERILERARTATEALRRQMAATTQLEAQNLRLRRREEILNRAFESARRRLHSLVEQPEYEALASDLVREGVARLGGHTNKVIVRADPQTRTLLEGGGLSRLAESLQVHLELGPPLAWGTGVVLETAEGHRRYDNTLESRLERMREELRTPVYRRLIEGKEGG